MSLYSIDLFLALRIAMVGVATPNSRISMTKTVITHSEAICPHLFLDGMDI